MPPHIPITGVTVRLQDACKFPKELPGALSATIQLEIEHYRSARSTILPEISPVILALGSFGLHIDGRFIGLNVTTAQKFPAHCPNDSHEQFTDSHDPTAERNSGESQSGFPFQHRTLAKQRQVIAVFVDDRVDHYPIAGQTFLDNPWGQRRALDPQFFATTAGALFPLGHQNEVFCRFDIQLLAGLIANEFLLFSALGTDGLFWRTGDNLFHPWQVCR